MISSASILGMAFSLVVSFLFPVILAIYFLRKYKNGALPLICGISVFILFALVLEQIFHMLVLGPGSPLADSIKGSPWLLGLYGGLAAGVFEETGRLLAFMYLLKKTRDWSHGCTYGIGHGGIESWILVSLASVSNLVLALLSNSGGLEAIKATIPADQIASIDQAILTLAETDSYLFFFGGIERLMVIVIHIALSLLVLYAVRNRKYLFFILAIALHALLNFPLVFIGSNGIHPLWAELWVFLFMAAGLVWIIRSKSLLAPTAAVTLQPNPGSPGTDIE